ncbi:MAG: major capsid protein [Bosea sp.]|uniref:major capsid protein n=1 Tax=Bosea sp. (in: a-proteobacteria) TaxID=1871050 RepID=UPI00238FC706|nr:major capsid protein [Bosea sp. (in: a-proteobacteria)]MCP4738457.1 major capsid protein [Bosea sp. (in: a-proteobacteria)]
MEFVFPYDSITLTNEVNTIPNEYGLMQALNLFPSEPIATTTVMVTFADNKLRVLPERARGDKGTPGQTSENRGIPVQIPHFPAIDNIGPSDIQNKAIIVDGRPVPMTVAAATAKMLAMIRRKHAITREYLRVNALKGIVKDGDGTTLANFFHLFDIAPQQVDLVLGTPGTNMIDKVEEIYDKVHAGVVGDTVSRVEVVIGSSLFSKFVQHAKVEKYWMGYQAAQGLANMNRHGQGNDHGRTFEFGNVFFREYKGQVPLKAGNEHLVDPAKGHAYPAGTNETFATYDGPPHHMDRVNTPGEEIFISEKILDHGEGVEAKSQSNALPVCKRPKALVEVISSN